MTVLPRDAESYIPIADVQAHLRLDYIDQDDMYLIGYMRAAAIRKVSNDINRVLYPIAEVPDTTTHPNSIIMSEDLMIAALMLIAYWYENRESVVVGVSAKEAPQAYWFLIGQYRILQSG